MRKVKYVVNIGYYEFEFDDMVTATTFANMAARHIVRDNSRIYIELEREEIEDDLPKIPAEHEAEDEETDDEEG